MPLAMKLLEDTVWQMSIGERAAVEGLLCALSPRLAIEIGSAEGAGTVHLAARAEEVHAFDLAPPRVQQPSNVVHHTGDSHELLPRFLDELAGQGRNVDFALVDGDHSAAGVRGDIEALLNSRAAARTIIVMHDTANEEVRRGLDAIPWRAWPKVAHVNLDMVPGHVCRHPDLRHELWYGLGLVVLDAARPAYRRGLRLRRRKRGIHGYFGDEVVESRFYSSAELLRDGRAAVIAREGAAA
jgi:hypothetical protein